MREHDIRTVLGDQPTDADEAMRRAACGECGGTGELVKDGPRSVCGDCNGTGKSAIGLQAVIAAKDAEITRLYSRFDALRDSAVIDFEREVVVKAYEAWKVAHPYGLTINGKLILPDLENLIDWLMRRAEAAEAALEAAIKRAETAEDLERQSRHRAYELKAQAAAAPKQTPEQFRRTIRAARLAAENAAREKGGAFEWTDGEGTCEYPADSGSEKGGAK